jgi:citrate synthase
MATSNEESDWLRSSIGWSDADHITIGGRDLAADLMGRLTLTELAYFLITGREPSPSQRRVLDTVLVALADHGLTPMALAARLTYTGAPESIQGAVAAGLLGAGSVFLGPAGDTADFLTGALAAYRGEPGPDDDTLHRIAGSEVQALHAAGLRVPGLGHPVHREADPRTARLHEVATEENLVGPHLRLLELVGAAHAELTGRRLPVNGAGAGGAALLDVGLPATSVRGFVLIGRTAGLVAHLAEEAEHPLGLPLWLEVEERSRPAGDPDG